MRPLGWQRWLAQRGTGSEWCRVDTLGCHLVANATLPGGGTTTGRARSMTNVGRAPAAWLGLSFCFGGEDRSSVETGR